VGPYPVIRNKDGADGTPPEDPTDDTATTIAALGSAKALIVATPVYRGSLTGSLKNLRYVLSFFGAMVMPVAVYLDSG